MTDAVFAIVKTQCPKNRENLGVNIADTARGCRHSRYCKRLPTLGESQKREKMRGEKLETLNDSKEINTLS